MESEADQRHQQIWRDRENLRMGDHRVVKGCCPMCKNDTLGYPELAGVTLKGVDLREGWRPGVRGEACEACGAVVFLLPETK